ncbi:3-keto-5-aminohexanoate cleavage protein [Candidatus Solirubrobacter pratensis]|uniref:3-keto-5-aminohexanoate cleavage protein n=1 Tax=Candidatus Solirubrobacter pratensis TaxID=1298857 RepID=UPI0003FED179|nr:3-keto-5-aminohexanoate cleavage protein [Candidatus Solirubrobacter pratensis]
MIQACLNGSRAPEEHSALPVTPEQLEHDARAVVSAGAGSVHVHPRDGDGAETLEPAAVAAAVHAIRVAAPRLELSLSTGVWITGGDAAERLRLISGWTERPDLCSVNFSEPGWEELIALLGERGIEVEAGLWSVEDAEALAGSGLVESWGAGSHGRGRRHLPVRRILVEPHDESPEDAIARAAAIDAVLNRAAIPTPRLHHGYGPATYAVIDAARARGHDVRIGLEDVLVLRDGSLAPGNAALLARANVDGGG